jgi:tRNA threonylcarbamoyladenosine biosynthesis protein TsaE
MYRITSPEDLETTGFYDYIENGDVLAIEWSENIAEALPDGTVYIDIERVSDDVREITITGDERFEAIGD